MVQSLKCVLKITKQKFINMSHVKSNYSNPLGSLDGMMKEFFNEFPSTVSKSVREDVLQFPPVNITNNADNYLVELLVPGYTKADFKVKLEENILTVSAEQKHSELTEGSKVVRKEFSLKAFKRSFTLDDKMDTENISAKYENGLLQLTLPKKEQVKPQAKDISIS